MQLKIKIINILKKFQNLKFFTKFWSPNFQKEKRKKENIYLSIASFNSLVASFASSKVGTPPNTILGMGSPAAITKSPASANSQSSNSYGAAACSGAISAGFAPCDDTMADAGREAFLTDCSAGWAAGAPLKPVRPTPMPAILAAVLIAPPPPMVGSLAKNRKGDFKGKWFAWFTMLCIQTCSFVKWIMNSCRVTRAISITRFHATFVSNKEPRLRFSYRPTTLCRK